jgi:hypothetical protein
VSARAALAAAAAALLIIGTAPTARAQAAEAPSPPSAEATSEPVTASVEGHIGCRDSEFFLQQIFARTSRARRAAAGEAGRVFVVRIVQRQATSTGTLDIRDVSGAQSHREVTAATCDEVMAALALVAALTIDPQAVTTPVPVPPPPTAPPEPPPVTEPPKPKPPPPKRAPEPKTAPPDEVPKRDEAAGPRRHVRLGALVAAEVMSGFAPDVALLPRAGIELEIEMARHSWLVPSLRLSAARGEHETDTIEGVGRASFVWTGARLEVCPVRAGTGVGPYARPCLGSDFAAVDASGRDLPDPKSATRPWIAPLASVRAGWRLPFGLAFELYAGGSFPLVDDQFMFDDKRNSRRVLVHEVPPLCFFAGLAAGMSVDIL